jgi:hypothetical protein
MLASIEYWKEDKESDDISYSSSLVYLSRPRRQAWPETRAPSPPHAQSFLESTSSSSSLQLPGAQHKPKGILQGGLAGDAGVSPVAGTMSPLFEVGRAHSCRDFSSETGGKTTGGQGRLLCGPTTEIVLKCGGIQPSNEIRISQGNKKTSANNSGETQLSPQALKRSTEEHSHFVLYK